MEIFKQSNIAYYMFPDDIRLYLKISSLEDVVQQTNTLVNTQSWLAQNNLKLSSLKTKVLLFSPYNSPTCIQEWLNHLDTLNCKPTIIDSSKSFGIGIRLDKNMNRLAHISATTRSSSFQFNLLKKVKAFLPPQVFKQAVQSLVVSRLGYGSVTLSGLPKSRMAPLKATLNAAARLVTGTRRFDHMSPSLRSLNWLPQEARTHLKISCLTHKALHYNKPRVLAEKIHISGGSRSLRSAKSLKLKPY